MTAPDRCRSTAPRRHRPWPRAAAVTALLAVAIAACLGHVEESADDEPEPVEAAIDVAGHLAMAALPAAETAGKWLPWGTIPAGIAISTTGTVYWTQYRTDTIHARTADDAGPRTVARADGPLGLALADGRLFFAGDRHFPRSIGVIDVDEDGGRPFAAAAVPEVGPLVGGMILNRPLAVATAGGALYWTESVNGRIRRLVPGTEDVETLYDDGIANVDEADDARAMSPAGLAVDADAGVLFWSDLRSGAIYRARIDGSEPGILLSRADGLHLPTGLAVDPASATLFWADAAASRISRATYDGSGVTVVADSDDGVLEPWALALDAERRTLWWTDLAADAILGWSLDDAGVRSTVQLADAAPAPATDSPCGLVGAILGRDYLRDRLHAVRVCMVALTAIKAVMRAPEELGLAAPLCRDKLAAMPGPAWLDERIDEACPADERSTLRRTLGEDAATMVARDLPRSGDYLGAVRPFVAAIEPESPRTRAACAAIDELRETPAAPPVASPALRSGIADTAQTTHYQATTNREEPVVDDAVATTGAPMRFTDNGDGTVTDLVSGLVWEKKCADCPGLHDVNARYVWNDGAVAAWLDAVRRENGSGFAGRNDWRLPRIEELVGILDFERFNPSVGPAFDGPGCGLDCSSIANPDCSCTNLGAYWTTGTSPRSEDVVPVVGFQFGAVWGQPSDSDAFLRAVRGPARVRADRFVDNGDGTVTDRVTRLMWEKKCLRPGDLHDVDRQMYWSFDGSEETLWDWVAAVNHEDGDGFAGHDDWRIPDVKELLSLFDDELQDPAIDRVFAADGCADVVDPRCSLTSYEPHWTSTTFADFPALALTVNFNQPGDAEDAPEWVIRVVGGLEPHQKTMAMVARAVRGPLAP